MTEIRVPTLGESVTEATIGRWFKKAGDAGAGGRSRWPSSRPTRSRSKSTRRPPACWPKSSPRKARRSRPARCSVRSRRAARPPRPRRGRPRTRGGAAKPVAEAPEQARRRAAGAMPPSPAAAKIAAEQGVDLSQVAGSGKRGQALKCGRHRIRRPAAAPAPACARGAGARAGAARAPVRPRRRAARRAREA